MSELTDRIRRDFRAGDMGRDAGITMPEGVTRWENISYGPDVRENVLDVYKPEGQEDKVLPVLISVHGGAWVYGDKDLYRNYCMVMAKQGLAVVNFTYRLAPESKLNDQIEDINLVVAWILKHGTEYGLDTDHIFLMGDSAGAHMASIYTCICTNLDYAAQFPFQVVEGFCPTAVILNCGIYCFYDGVEKENEATTLLTDLMPDVVGEDWKDRYNQISPCYHVTDKFPPVFLMSAKGDYLVGQVPFMEKALKEHQVPYVKHIYGNEENPLCHVFHLDLHCKEGFVCDEEEGRFVQGFVK